MLNLAFFRAKKLVIIYYVNVGLNYDVLFKNLVLPNFLNKASIFRLIYTINIAI